MSEDGTAGAEADVTAPSSAYTSLEDKDCRDLAPVGEEMLLYREVCAGMPGYELLVEDVDARSNVQVKAGDKTMDLAVWSRLPAFSRLGSKAEWRGPVTSPGVVDPYALIFRYFQSDGEGHEKSYLVVSRITQEAACIVDMVDGGEANANVRAREIADGARDFQCPTKERPPQATSIFTTLEDCPVVASSDDEGWANMACTGTGGYSLDLHHGDLRENVVVKRGAAEADLNLWAIGNGGFSRVGPTADWRVHGPDRKVHGLVFRFFQVTGPDADAENNWLVVSKIAGDHACIYDVIDAKKHPNANVLAHEAADESYANPCPARTPAAR
ncbi:MAG: hypothetical protein KIT84_22900 [Labilithrix sp.]|nr:hypothetical protein [Labilithrix sp.]MCW5813894.1 hypothetical protein [Labilithrix sp.]